MSAAGGIGPAYAPSSRCRDRRLDESARSSDGPRPGVEDAGRIERALERRQRRADGAAPRRPPAPGAPRCRAARRRAQPTGDGAAARSRAPATHVGPSIVSSPAPMPRARQRRRAPVATQRHRAQYLAAARPAASCTHHGAAAGPRHAPMLAPQRRCCVGPLAQPPPPTRSARARLTCASTAAGLDAKRTSSVRRDRRRAARATSKRSGSSWLAAIAASVGRQRARIAV